MAFTEIVSLLVRHPIRALGALNRGNLAYALGCLKDGNLKALAAGTAAAVACDRPARPRLVHGSVDPQTPVHFAPCGAPVVSIIVSAQNRWTHTHSCLTSIQRDSADIPFEVIIADDGSSDLTARVGDFAPGARAVTVSPGQGPLRTWNKAAMLARGQFLLFLHNDTEVQQNWLSELLRAIETDETVGMVGPKVLHPDGTVREAGGIVWSDAATLCLGDGDVASKPQYNYRREVDYLPGTCIMVRKELWARTGGFDDRFAMSDHHDVDLAFTARKCGYRVMFEPRSVVVHLGTCCWNKRAAENDGKAIFLEKWRDTLTREHTPAGEGVFLARDRCRSKKTVLFVDYQVPRYDMFAGSRTNLMYLRLLVRMGLNVKFIPADFERMEPYSSTLNDMGIETLDGRWSRDNWKKWILENSRHIDYVFFNKPDPTIQFLDFLREHTEAKIIYQGHDLHFLRLRRKFDLDRNDRTLAEANRYERIEKEIFSKSDAILSFSSYESELIGTLCPQQPVVTVPLYFYEKFDNPTSDFSARKDLLFVGGFAHAPNADAVVWFCSEAMPIILRSLPDVVLHVIGADAPPAITALASEHVEIVGFVGDDRLKEYYHSCRIVVIPLRFGAGVKGKTVEALYHGTPIVSTSVGVEGIPGIEAIATPADTAEDFALQVVSMYRDLEALADASMQNVAFVKDRYSVEAACRHMETLLSRLELS